MTRAGEKVLTMTLGSTCAVLFVFAVAMQFGLGRGYHWLEATNDNADPAVSGAIDREPFVLPPESNFAAIQQRPLFNEDRKPTPEIPEGPGDEPPPSPLNISLTGIVLAGKPEVRIAMVRENGKATTTALKEGMPLPGDQGSWTLSQVKKRSAIFKSSAGEEAEVELAVATASQKPGAPARPGAPNAPANRAANPPNPAGTPAVAAQGEELQHRIEERRKQMREAAERMKAQRQNEPQQPPQQEPQQQ